MSGPTYIVHQFILAGDGWSRFHIVESGQSLRNARALCKRKMKGHVQEQFAGPIEGIIRRLPRRYRNYNNRRACKQCWAEAQKLRNPLERLSEV